MREEKNPEKEEAKNKINPENNSKKIIIKSCKYRDDFVNWLKKQPYINAQECQYYPDIGHKIPIRTDAKITLEDQITPILDFAASNVIDAKVSYRQRSFWIEPYLKNSNNEIDLSQADIEPGGPQPRTQLEEQSIYALAQQIKVDGKQKQAIDCFPSPINRGKYQISDGNRRYAAIFHILKWSKIRAKITNMTKIEAWQNAITANVTQKRLNDFDLGKALSESMLNYPEEYPTQEALIEKFPCLNDTGITDRSRISQLISDYKLKSSVLSRIDPKIVTAVTKIPERITREIHNIPKIIMPYLLEEVASKNLTAEQTKEAAKKINERITGQLTLKITKEEVTQIVEQIISSTKDVIEDKKAKKQDNKAIAQLLIDNAAKDEKKTERILKKFNQAIAFFPPQEISEAIYSHLSQKGKVSPEQAQSYTQFFISAVLKGISKEALNEALDRADGEAAKW